MGNKKVYKKNKESEILVNQAESTVPFAIQSSNDILSSREHPTKLPTLRSEFERDRDRILHSKAFRRLAHKSQVFIYYYGDHHRSRLTHTLEVEAISCSISGLLRLNMFLVSTIALSHDLGAPPFGKAGEYQLNKLMKKNSLQGFHHNHQGIRVVENLEKQYPDYKGLNLTLAVKEGILKHGKVDKKFLNLHSKHLTDFIKKTKLNTPSTLEAQAVNVSDDITEIYHYIEDGLRYDLIPLDLIFKNKLWKEAIIYLNKNYNIDFSKFISKSEFKNDKDILKLAVCRFLIKYMVSNVIQNSGKNIKKIGETKLTPGKIDTIIIDFNPKARNLVDEFFEEIVVPYIIQNNELLLISRKCENVIENIFKMYKDYPELLPKETYRLYQAAKELNGNVELRVIIDHISGMSDRYALKTYKELFDVSFMPFPAGYKYF